MMMDVLKIIYYLLIVSEIELELGNDTSICNGTPLILDAGFNYETYLWNNQSTNQTISVSQAGEYIVEVSQLLYDNCDSLDYIQGFSLIETYNGKAYYISDNTFDNWDEARSACILAGGDLISIESEELNNFLYQNLSPSVNNYWIGLYQDLNSEYYQEPNFGWMWVNGNPLSFTNWDTHGDYLADEPNNLKR